ncbi:MAG: hypothetical protein HY052_01885 [Proteobacteria bacterium]|nr:hypothetical protein [Pseudomonadota bacterium]
MPSQRSIRGNALFLILIGVVMFAALAFAVSRHWRGSGNVVSVEQARLQADEMIEYGNGLRVLIDRMLTLGGAEDTNIWFAATGADAAYGAVGAHASAEVFNAAGGAATYQVTPAHACLSDCAYEFSGQYTLTGIGTDSPELVMLVIDVNPAVCQKINDLLEMGWSTIPTGGALTALARFNGSTYGGAAAITLTGGANEFVGKNAFCYAESGGAGRNIYLQVLRAR